ncbi:proton-coupled amino acid transporter-like protein CG1139 [Nilaparvata lugens]|uniref:proton-coupled amino acid transporter-like protein CG1139 n=1 Tax=Nilaparvata lugens TaxID=108931 RepID=UPI00193DF43A|nr:proton-coupled amino acid transporter-like protein CG1139 [Nilaparvata lugens]
MKKNISTKHLFWEYVLRTAAVLITFVLAVAVPRLELFISLFGAFCLSALGIAFPAIIEICVMWPDNLGTGYYILFRNFLLILFGIAGLLVGTYTSISDIITSFSK